MVAHSNPAGSSGGVRGSSSCRSAHVGRTRDTPSRRVECRSGTCRAVLGSERLGSFVGAPRRSRADGLREIPRKFKKIWSRSRFRSGRVERAPTRGFHPVMPSRSRARFKVQLRRPRLVAGDRSRSCRNWDCDLLAESAGLLPSRGPKACSGLAVPA
jgi:hypothetical protein